MKELRLCINCLLAPLQASREEPSDGEDDPPEGASHEEEVKEHGSEGAAPVMMFTLKRKWPRYNVYV